MEWSEVQPGRVGWASGYSRVEWSAVQWDGVGWSGPRVGFRGVECNGMDLEWSAVQCSGVGL